MESANRACWGLGRVLKRWDLDGDAVAEATAVVYELLRNVVEHARTEWRLTVELRGALLHLTVEDGLVGPGPRTARTEGEPAGHVSGLRVVNALALRWGWREHELGKSVWVELLA